MHFSTILALVATSVGLAVAAPSADAAVPLLYGGDGDVVLSKESGCGSTGPLGPGHYKWWIVVSCNPGARL